MLWKRLHKDLHSDESSRMHNDPSYGTVGIQDLSGNVSAVGWAFNGMNR